MFLVNFPCNILNIFVLDYDKYLTVFCSYAKVCVLLDLIVENVTEYLELPFLLSLISQVHKFRNCIMTKFRGLLEKDFLIS